MTHSHIATHWHSNTLQHTATHGSTLPHTATLCNTLHDTASHYNKLHHTATHNATLATDDDVAQREVFPLAATHCITLQHTAAHCSTLLHTATHCNTSYDTATHCNTLQHTALATDDVAQREACPLAVALQQLQRVMPTQRCSCTLALQHTATHCNSSCSASCPPKN